MRKVSLTSIPETEKRSPRGKYRSFIKEISIALGREPSSLDLTRRHPFDLALPPGATLCTTPEAKGSLYLPHWSREPVRRADFVARDRLRPVNPLKRLGILWIGTLKAGKTLGFLGSVLISRDPVEAAYCIINKSIDSA